MPDPIPVDNQTQTTDGTPDNNGADLTTIMQGMSANGDKPEANPNGDKPEGTVPGAEQKENKAELPAWTSQLNDELKNNGDVMNQLSKFAKLSDLAKSYSELEKKLGSSLTKPNDDASDEEKQAFYEKLGKPKSANDYSIKEEEAEQFRQLAFKNNLTDTQAKELYGEFVKIGQNFLQQHQENMQAMARDTQNLLKKEYGNEYDAKLKMLQKGVMTYGGKSLSEKLQKTGLLYDADVVKMFVLLGEQSSEANGADKTSTANGNGYKSTLEGGHFDFSIKN